MLTADLGSEAPARGCHATHVKIGILRNTERDLTSSIRASRQCRMTTWADTVAVLTGEIAMGVSDAS
jgi:hypothetical protein